VTEFRCYRCKELMTPQGTCGCKDGICLICGDCREVLPWLEAGCVDLVLTDPPYGINHSTNYGASWAGRKIDGDHDPALRDWLVAWAGSLPMAVFGTPKVSPPSGTRGTLIWDKGPAFGMGDLSFPWKASFEEIYILGKGWNGTRDEGVIRGHIVVSWESKGRVHQHQKPVSLLRYLATKHPGQAILDPFVGSGTTLRAAKDLGRRAIGIEIEEKYCRIAAARLAQEVLFT